MLLKCKLTHIKIFKCLFVYTSFLVWLCQTKGDQGPSTARGWGEIFCREDLEAKQGNYWIGYSLGSCLIWESLVGCFLGFLKFHFPGFKYIDSGLDFGLLAQAPEALDRATSVQWPPCLNTLTTLKLLVYIYYPFRQDGKDWLKSTLITYA